MKLQNITSEKLRAILLLNGLNYSVLAERHGFNKDAVHKAVVRYVGKKCPPVPRGQKTKAILNILEQYCADFNG